MSFPQNIITDEFAQAMGWTLLNSVWQGFLVFLILFTILGFLSQKNSNLRYLITLVFLFGFVVWVSINFVNNLGQYIRDPVVASSDLKGVTRDLDPALFKTSTITSIRHTLFSAMNSIGEFILQNCYLLTILWILGVVLFGTRFLGGMIYAGYGVMSGRETPSGRLVRMIHNVKQKMHIGSRIRIFESARIKIPQVFGSVKPVLLVPAELISGIPANQVEAIIAHELAHIKRHDFLVNVVQSLVEVLFFYHPAVWWMSNFIRKERENSCDDMAMQYCEEEITYVKALSNMQNIHSKKLEIMIAFSNNKHRLLARIERLLKCDSNRSNSLIVPAVSVLLLLTVVAFKPKPVQEPLRNELAVEISSPGLLTWELINPGPVTILQDTLIKKKQKKDKKSPVRKEESKEVEIRKQDIDEDIEHDDPEFHFDKDFDFDFNFDFEDIIEDFQDSIYDFNLHFSDSFQTYMEEINDNMHDVMDDLHLELQDVRFCDSIDVDWEEIRDEMEKLKIEMGQIRAGDLRMEMERVRTVLQEQMKEMRVEMRKFREEEMPRLKEEIEKMLEEQNKTLEKKKKDTTSLKYREI